MADGTVGPSVQGDFLHVSIRILTWSCLKAVGMGFLNLRHSRPSFATIIYDMSLRTAEMKSWRGSGHS